MAEHGVWADLNVPPTYEQLQECTYLEAALKETLRLYPPASVSRYTKDLNQTYNGYAIGGALLLMSTYVMHHHPSLWKEPEAFRPERFLDGSEEGLADKFIPFSRGPRDCIGKYFALLEGKIAVSAMVARYDFECIDPNETIKPQLTSLPRNGAKVRFSRRAYAMC